MLAAPEMGNLLGICVILSPKTNPRSGAESQEFIGKTGGCIKEKKVLPGTVYIWRGLGEEKLDRDS